MALALALGIGLTYNNAGSGSAVSVPGYPTVVFTQDGLVITMSGTGGTNVTVIQDAIGMYGVVAPSGVTITALPTIDPTRTTETFATLGTANYVGGIMVDPAGLLMQGFDNRSTSGFGPAMNYDASLAATLPLTVNAASKPKTIWFYRGLDTVQGGGANCGCAFIVHVTIFASMPAAGWIRPSIYAGDKTVYTTNLINYSAFTPVTLPVGAVEKDWSDIHYLRRPLIQSSEYQIGVRLPSSCNPCGSQDPYPAYQAEYTGDLLLGAISTSSSRNDLINRIVACGLDIHAQTLVGGGPFVSGGGFGVGYPVVRYFAGKFLGIPAMCDRPELTNIARLGGGAEFLVDFFAEDGNAFRGAVAAGYADGKPLFGILGAGYPTGPYADNHSSRDPAGLREPFWLLPTAVTLTGTVQAGTTNSITLAAGQANGTITYGNRIYNSRGGGQTIYIASDNTLDCSFSGTNMTVNTKSFGGVIRPMMYVTGTGVAAGTYIVSQTSGTTGDTGVYVISANVGTLGSRSIALTAYSDTTKRCAMLTDWATPPQAGDTYEFYNGGSYHGLNLKPTTAPFAALVLAGYGIQWLNPVAMALQKRWVDEGALFTPTVRMAQDASQDTSTFQTWTRSYNGDSGGTWCKKFYDAAIATGNWPVVPSITAPIVSSLSPLDGTLTVVKTSNLVITFSENVTKNVGNITIRHTSDDSVFQTIDVTSGAVSVVGAVATITHTTFADAGQYYVRVDYDAFRDASSNPFFGIHSKTAWNFAVATPGAVYVEQSAGPSEGANQGAFATYIDRSWIIDNNATINSLGIYCAGSNPGSVTLRIWKRDSEGVYSNVASAVPTAVTHTGWQNINLSAPYLIPTTGEYYVSVYANANVWDRWTTNRAYSGGGDISGPNQSISESSGVNGPMTRATGTLLDITAPTLSTLSPANSATGIATTANLVITLSEQAQAGTGSITLYKTSDNSVIQTFNVATDVVFAGSTATLNPTSDLAGSTGFYVKVPSGTITDTAGNPFAGWTSTTAWAFTTAAPSVVRTMAGGLRDETFNSACTLVYPSGVVAGNRGVAIVTTGFSHTGATALTAPSGWTLVAQAADPTSASDGGIYVYKTTGTFAGTEGGTSISWTATGSCQNSIVFLEYTGAGTVAATINTTTIDPPSHNAGSSAQTVWLAVMRCRVNNNAVTAPPSGGWSTALEVQSSTTHDTNGAQTTLGASYLETVATSMDPGTFTTTGAITEGPMSCTVSIR